MVDATSLAQAAAPARVNDSNGMAISEYEMMRRMNMKANDDILKTLGLANTVEKKPNKPKQPMQGRKKKSTAQNVPTRDLRSTSPKDYNENRLKQKYVEVDGTPSQSKKRQRTEDAFDVDELMDMVDGQEGDDGLLEVGAPSGPAAKFCLLDGVTLRGAVGGGDKYTLHIHPNGSVELKSTTTRKSKQRQIISVKTTDGHTVEFAHMDEEEQDRPPVATDKNMFLKNLVQLERERVHSNLTDDIITLRYNVYEYITQQKMPKTKCVLDEKLASVDFGDEMAKKKAKMLAYASLAERTIPNKKKVVDELLEKMEAQKEVEATSTMQQMLKGEAENVDKNINDLEFNCAKMLCALSEELLKSDEGRESIATAIVEDEGFMTENFKKNLDVAMQDESNLVLLRCKFANGGGRKMDTVLTIDRFCEVGIATDDEKSRDGAYICSLQTVDGRCSEYSPPLIAMQKAERKKRRAVSEIAGDVVKNESMKEKRNTCPFQLEDIEHFYPEFVAEHKGNKYVYEVGRNASAKPKYQLQYVGDIRYYDKDDSKGQQLRNSQGYYHDKRVAYMFSAWLHEQPFLHRNIPTCVRTFQNALLPSPIVHEDMGSAIQITFANNEWTLAIDFKTRPVFWGSLLPTEEVEGIIESVTAYYPGEEIKVLVEENLKCKTVFIPFCATAVPVADADRVAKEHCVKMIQDGHIDARALAVAKAHNLE